MGPEILNFIGGQNGRGRGSLASRQRSSFCLALETFRRDDFTEMFLLLVVRNAWPEWDDSNGLQWPITFRKTEIEALSKIRVRLKSTSVEKGIEYRGCR